MAYKLDISSIIKDHLKTIINDNTGKPDFRDWCSFLCLPVAISICLIYFKIFLNDTYIGAIVSGLSIYIGLSLNLIVLLFGIIEKNGISDLRKDVVKDMMANASFSILLSLFTIIFSLLTQVGKSFKFYLYASHFITYFLLAEMLLVIILLINNMYYQFQASGNQP